MGVMKTVKYNIDIDSFMMNSELLMFYVWPKERRQCMLLDILVFNPWVILNSFEFHLYKLNVYTGLHFVVNISFEALNEWIHFIQKC